MHFDPFIWWNTVKRIEWIHDRYKMNKLQKNYIERNVRQKRICTILLNLCKILGIATIVLWWKIDQWLPG